VGREGGLSGHDAAAVPAGAQKEGGRGSACAAPGPARPTRSSAHRGSGPAAADRRGRGEAPARGAAESFRAASAGPSCMLEQNRPQQARSYVPE
jgi:hypothetical protein